MARAFRFKHSSKGYVKIMRSSAVRTDLARKGDAVARAARSRTDRRIFSDTYTGRSRAGATIGGVSMAEESRRRVLGSSIDAARRA